MDFTSTEFPSTVSFNTFKAYFDPAKVLLPKVSDKSFPIPAVETSETNINQPKSLRHLVLDAIATNWQELPLYNEIPRKEDRNYLLTVLDVHIPLKQLTAYIQEDFFWRRSYQQRWKTYPTFPTATEKTAKPWINIYMERHLQEFIQSLPTAEYEIENVQKTLDICSTYINQLKINHLQPATNDGLNDHIPLDFILSNLPELHTLHLAYSTKTVGTNFFLGCNTLSQNDIILLARGLSQSHELIEFCLTNTKLEPYQLRLLAHSLDKGCHKLTHLSLAHTSFGDDGIRFFLDSCTKESFSTLKSLDLSNNKISSEGAYILSRTIKGLALERLILRLNPIESDGAAAIFSVLHYLPLKSLDIAGCSLTESLTKLFMVMIIQNKTLSEIDLCNNHMGEDFGRNLYKVVGFNKLLEVLDLRNTGITLDVRNKIKDICRANRRNNKRRD